MFNRRRAYGFETGEAGLFPSVFYKLGVSHAAGFSEEN